MLQDLGGTFDDCTQQSALWILVNRDMGGDDDPRRSFKDFWGRHKWKRFSAFRRVMTDSPVFDCTNALRRNRKSEQTNEFFSDVARALRDKNSMVFNVCLTEIV